MSGAVNPTGLSLSELLLANSQSVAQKVSQYTEQSSTGLVSQNYAGLGQSASIALNLQPQVTRDKTLQTGITNATGAMTIAQSGLTQINTLTSNIVSQLNNLNSITASNVGSIAASAQSALQQVAGVLDQQSGGSYVFAGQDSANAPVPDPNNILNSGFYTQVSAAVGNLSTAGASSTGSTIQQIASSTAAGTTPFSASLESLAAAGDGRTTVQTGVDQSVSSVMLANQNGNVTASGSSSTGSYMRDILSGLATIGSLTSTSMSASDVQTLIQQVRTNLNAALSDLGSDQGILGNRQTQLTNTATALGNTATALGNQVSDVTKADLTQTATNLQQANTALQASYQLIAGLPKLSLVQYI